MKQKIKRFFKRLLAVLLLLPTLGALLSFIKGDYSIYNIFVGLMCLFFAVLLLKGRKTTDTTTNNSDSIPVPDNSRNQFVERPSTIYNPDTNAFSRNEISSPIQTGYENASNDEKESDTQAKNGGSAPIPDFSNIQYVEDNGGIRHADNSPITDEEIPYLIQLGTERALQRERESKNPKFHRTEREEELSCNFMMNHSSGIDKHVDKFENLYGKACAEKKIDVKIELLEQAISEFEKAKAWFYRTKGGTIYFQDMYEHLHNSRNDDFSYLDMIQDELDSCIDTRDVILPEIFEAIGEDGILQKDIYKFVETDKSEVQRILRELEFENKITREKKGNTYFITCNK